MSETTLRVAIDASGARPEARALDSDLARLKASGDGVTSSMDKLSKELGDLRSTLSAADQRSLALIKSQDSLTAALQAQERAVTSLTADLRAQAEVQRTLGQSTATVTESSRQQVVAQDQASRSGLALAGTARLLTAGFAGFTALQVARTIVETGAAFDGLDQKFKTVFGTAERGAQQLEFIRAESGRLGLSILSTANSYALLSAASLGTTLEGQKTHDIFSAISEASAKLNLSTEQTNGALTAVQQIISKGTVSAEELRGQLGERLPGAFQIAARAMGVTTQELGKLLEQGALASDVFLPKFTEELRRTFGTDANTRIESVTSNFARLTSEISQTAGALGQLANQSLGPLARDTGELLKALREDPGSASLTLVKQFGLQLQGRKAESDAVFAQLVNRNQASDFVAANPFKPQIDPFATSSRFSAVPQQAQQTGAGILSFGVPLADQKELIKLAEKEEAARARALGLTNEQRVQQSILNGELKDRNILEQQAELRIARLNDQIADNTKSKREGLKLETDSERLQKQALQKDAERGERADDLILKAQTQQQLLRQQLDTGVALTAAGQELAKLRAGELDMTFIGREAAKEQLAILLQQNAAIEEGVLAQDRRNNAAKKAAADLQEGPLAAGAAQRLARRNRRGGGGIFGTFEGINAEESASAGRENDAFAAKKSALEGGDEGSLRRDGLLKENETIQDLIERAEEAHQDKLTEIARNGAEQRNRLTQSYLQTGSQIVANFSDAAESAGLSRTKRGFEAAKILSITQATISTAAAVTNALAVPPYPLGVALAASAGIAGLAQIAAIKSQKFGGGRELGGPVDSSRFFEIGEKGRPEIIQDDGKYFLFGANGNVIPASNGNAGRGGAPVFNFELTNNGAPAQVTSSSVEEQSDGSYIVRAVMNEIDSRLTDNTSSLSRGVQRRAGRRAEGLIG